MKLHRGTAPQTAPAQTSRPRLGLGGDASTARRGDSTGAPTSTAPALAEGLEDKGTWRSRMGATRRRMLDDEQPQATWTTGSRLATRVSTVAVLAALAAGPVALGWQFLRPDAAPVEVAGSIDERLLSRRSVASEVAAQWVTAWLTTPEDRAGQLQAVFPGKLELPKVASTVGNVRVLDAVASDVGVWSVTVAADVTSPGGKHSARRYFRVPVAVAGEAGEVAGSPMSAPAPVPGPGATTYDAGSYGIAVASTAPLGQTISAYLAEGLTGADVTRYITPGTDLAQLVAPQAAYGSAHVVDIHADREAPGASDGQAPPDGAQLHALAQVELHEPGEAPDAGGLTATYPLTLTARGGRWEVSAIDTALTHTEDQGTQP